MIDAARHALATVALSFEQRLRVCAWDRCSAGINTSMKESDAQGLWKAEFSKKHVCPFVSRGVRIGERGTCLEEKRCVSRSLEE